VAAGAVLTAILFDVGRWAVSVYLGRSTQPSAFGAAASFAALLLWLYYTSLIFLFGAEFTACLGGLRDAKHAGELRMTDFPGTASPPVSTPSDTRAQGPVG
jgi:membrane protein